MPYIGRSTEALGVRTRFTYLASSGDTSVSGADVNGLSLSFTDGVYVDVFLNGVKLKSGDDYVTTTANTISSLSAMQANDEVEVIVYDVFTLADMVSSSDGGSFFGQVNFKTDSAVVAFGLDNDITLTHVADTGLNIKNTATGDDNPLLLTLQTGETDIAANDVIAKIAFQAPDEGTGTDAVLVNGAIQVRSEGDFAADNNATSMDFMTSASEAATTKMTLNSSGTLEVLKVGSGTAVNLKMDGTTIGGLGVISDRVYLEAEGSHSVYLDASANSFNPGSDTGTDNDGNIDLGASFARWKDLYIGGGIYVGGTGSANKLDDYEEGTYTVAMTAGSSGTITLNGSYNTGFYTKVGRLVHVAGDIRISSVSSPNGVLLISLPFTALNNGLAVSSNSMLTAGVTEQSSQDGPFFVRSLANTTTAEVFYDTDASHFTVQAQNAGLGSGDQFSFTLTYMTE